MSIIPFERTFASHSNAKHWNYEKNENINPINISLKSNKKYWFDCNTCNHTFDIALNNVCAGKWCPYCRSNKLCNKETCKLCFEKSFASHDKAKYWSSKNNKRPRMVTKKSDSEKFWFDCEKCIHEFDSTLYNISQGKWCPYCAIPTKRFCNSDCEVCFKKSFASHEKSQFWSDKNEIKPKDVLLGSNKSFKFNCGECHHEFEKTIGDITCSDGWCPYCCNPPQKLCSELNCNHCFNNSFASHEKHKYWSSENGNITPRQVFKSSSAKYCFDCNVCGHPFNSRLSSITGHDSWCPYCAHQQLCDAECKLCFDKSFASHEKSTYWSSKNGNITQRQVFKSSNQKYWFDCNICEHTFCSALSHITADHHNTWCPYCSNPPQKKCAELNCEYCFDRSFASHYKAKYWSSKNGDTTPRQVFKSTRTKYIFQCDDGHTFDTSLYSIVSGSWCPFCINKTESKLYEKIQPLYPTIITQFKQDWCKKKTHLPFDFCIKEHKIIVELDGPQHFRQVSNWSSPEEQLDNDKYKEKCANCNGYSIIRILQEDVYYDTYDWVKELCDAIEELIRGNEVANVYLSTNEDYDKY